jgi:RNA polymerase sigma factor (TIGR02999 family)
MSDDTPRSIGDSGPSSDPRAAGELLPLVYDELRRLAADRMAHELPGSLDATALVHEAYLRLADAGSFTSRAHFFRAAAQAMRRILIDHARARKAEKRGGSGRRLQLSAVEGLVVAPDPDTMLTIDEALDSLARDDPLAAELARLRLFVGLSIEEAGASLGVARATAFRDWAYARACLCVALAGGEKTKNL